MAASIREGLRRLLRPDAPGPARVGVVLSCAFADAALLPAALGALLGRAREDDVEVAVVVAPWGPGNPDALVAAVQALSATHDVRLAELSDTGNGARNTGAAVVRGDLLLFLDPRDRLRPGALAALIECAVTHDSRVVRSVGDANPLHPAGFGFDARHWRESGLGFDEAHGDYPEATCARALIARPDRVPGRAADRVATGTSSRSEWPQQIEGWLQMVPAVRQTVTGPVKAQWIRHLLTSDLPDLLADLDRLDRGLLPAVADTVGAVLAALPPNDLARVPVRERMVAWLAGQARWVELSELHASSEIYPESHPGEGDESAPQFPTRLDGTRIRAELPGVEPTELHLPAAMLEVGLEESPLRGSVRRVRWLTGDQGDVVGGPVLAVDVLLHVRYVSLDSPTVQARWVDAAGSARPVAAVVRRHRDPYAELVAGQTFQDAAEASVTVLITLAGLPEGVWRLELGVRQGELVRTAFPRHRDVGGSAGSLRPSPDGRAQPVWDDDGLGVVVSAADGVEPPATTEARVVRARREDDWLAFDLDGPAQGPPLLDAGHLAIEGHVDGTIVRFRLQVDRFGTGPRPAPSGAYRLLLGHRPARWEDVAVDDLARDLVTPDHRVGLRRTPHDSVLVLLRPPLADDELGARPQYRLREVYDQHRPLEARLLLESVTGRCCTGSPLAIDRAVALARPQLPRVWAVEDRSVLPPPGATTVLRHSREWFALLASSQWLVTDGDLPEFFDRRHGQEVVQTLPAQPTRWVGEPAWRAARVPEPRIRRLLAQGPGQWTVLLSPGPELDDLLRESFGFDGTLLDVGLPRGDLVVGHGTTSRRERTRAALGVAPGETVVLYAPDAGPRPPRSTRMRSLLDVAELCEGLGEDWVVLHLGAQPLRPVRPGGARLLDVTGHPHPDDLVLACDAAVLDYSPLRFDLALAGRPMVFFVPDPAVRRGDVRGFAVPFLETAPGPVVSDVRDVVAQLLDLNGLESRHGAQLARFNARFQPFADGHAADRVVEHLFGRQVGLAVV